MNFVDTFMIKWENFCRKMQPTVTKAERIFKLVADKTVYTWNYVSKFRKLFLAAPVAAMALILALQNLIKLPALVGLSFETDGSFSFEMIRELAVLGPLAVTAICLLLMFISKRTLTPWLVSVFSLALPLLILVMNTLSF